VILLLYYKHNKDDGPS